MRFKPGFFNYSITLTEEAYYRSLSILSLVELDDDLVAILPEYKAFVGIVDRAEKRELYKI